MGIYSDYLDKNFTFEQLAQERKRFLKIISEITQGDVLVFAADLTKNKAPISINIDDILPFKDQLSNLSGKKISVILETPGGAGEVAEDLVKQLRQKYSEVAFIIPNSAKSAGTIMAMAGDDILMEPSSSLGPIDAQLIWQGKVFSADAFLDGFKKIKDEVDEKGNLNRAYIPILQGISPGELEAARNAKMFAIRLVKDWLANYKFKNWTIHSSTGQPVTPEEKVQRANRIAEELSNHAKWLTHGRSIKMADLEGMQLKITDYSQNAPLYDAITRYYMLLQMSFQTAIYKVFETPISQIYRFQAIAGAPAGGVPIPEQNDLKVEAKCGKCNHSTAVQIRLDPNIPKDVRFAQYPKGGVLICPKCRASMNLSPLKMQIEAQTRKQIVLE